jgi:hypothetical protein
VCTRVHVAHYTRRRGSHFSAAAAAYTFRVNIVIVFLFFLSGRKHRRAEFARYRRGRKARQCTGEGAGEKNQKRNRVLKVYTYGNRRRRGDQNAAARRIAGRGWRGCTYLYKPSKYAHAHAQ